MFGNVFGSLERVYPRSLKFLAAPLNRLVRARLWLQVLVGMVLGVGVGLLLNPDAGWLSPEIAAGVGEWLALPGRLFLAFIQMIVVPLILASIIRGIAAATDVGQLKKTGLGLAVYFVATTAAAAALGVAIGLVLKPGTFVDPEVVASVQGEAAPEIAAVAEMLEEAPDSAGIAEVPQHITNVLPTNPLSSIVEGEMLQIVIFSIVIGVGLLSIPVASAKPLLELLGSIQQICMAVVGIAMTFAPIAVFGLLAQAMIKAGAGVLTGMGLYAAVVVLGMALLLVFYLLLAALLGGRNPFRFLAAIREPLLLAFSMNSSAATMPVTVRNAEEVLRVRPSLAQFIVPLGATMNMGGTALYQSLATIFMSQLFGMDLAVGVLLALVVTTVGASIGTPGVPGVGIVVLASVLSSVGVPFAGLSLIIGLDQVLERFRTSLNVTGDLVACVVMERLVPRSHGATESEIADLHEAGHEDVVVRGT